MTSLDEILALAPIGTTRFSATMPDGWQQGRGAFGGIVIAFLIRAADAVNADPTRALRSVSAEICAPVEPGALELVVEVLRAGSGVSTIASRIVQGDEVRAHAVCVFGRARDATLTWGPLKVPPPVETIPIAPASSFMPAFWNLMELRIDGAVPFTGTRDPIVSGYVRPRLPGRRDAAWIALCADVFYPGLMCRFTSPRPMATLSYTLELLAPLDGLPPDAPVYHEALSPAASDGFSVELRELRGVDGRLIAMNQQLFVAIR